MPIYLNFKKNISILDFRNFKIFNRKIVMHSITHGTWRMLVTLSIFPAILITYSTMTPCTHVYGFPPFSKQLLRARVVEHIFEATTIFRNYYTVVFFLDCLKYVIQRTIHHLFDPNMHDLEILPSFPLKHRCYSNQRCSETLLS